MKNIFLIVFIFLSSFSFAQEKTYRFLYDFHQQTTLTDNERNKNEFDFVQMYEHALNKSYEVEVVTSTNYSFVKVVEVLDNNPIKFFYLGPRPKWYLVDFKENKTFEEQRNQYVSDSISQIKITPTRNIKTILGIEAREFSTENDDYTYSFWLAKMNGVTVSPIYYQFDGYIVMEIKITSKIYEREGGKKIIQYKIKDIDEQVFNFKKVIPKKYLSLQESKGLYDKIMEINRYGVEKD